MGGKVNYINIGILKLSKYAKETALSHSIFQLINVKEMMEIKKITICKHNNTKCDRQESSVEAKTE